MVRSCCFPGCSSRWRRGSDANLTFHRFPKSENIRKQWLDAVQAVVQRGRDWEPSVNQALCSKHFEEKCFDRTGQTTRMRADAVPSIFPQRPGTPSTTQSSTEIEVEAMEVVSVPDDAEPSVVSPRRSQRPVVPNRKFSVPVILKRPVPSTVHVTSTPVGILKPPTTQGAASAQPLFLVKLPATATSSSLATVPVTIPVPAPSVDTVLSKEEPTSTSSVVVVPEPSAGLLSGNDIPVAAEGGELSADQSLVGHDVSAAFHRMKDSINRKGSNSGVFCGAHNCYNRQGWRPDMTFFKFPRSENLCRLWLAMCGRNDLVVPAALHRKVVLCAEHFEDSQFTNSKRERLLPAAVPRIFGGKVLDIPPGFEDCFDEDPACIFDVVKPASVAKDVRCTVAGCFSKSGEDVYFYDFPKDNKLAAEWLEFVADRQEEYLTNSYICENHFDENNLRKNSKGEKLLHKSAVPFNPNHNQPLSDVTNVQGKWTCPCCCSRTFHSRQELQSHITEVSNSIKCPACKKSFSSLKLLAAHLAGKCGDLERPCGDEPSPSPRGNDQTVDTGTPAFVTEEETVIEEASTVPFTVPDASQLMTLSGPSGNVQEVAAETDVMDLAESDDDRGAVVVDDRDAVVIDQHRDGVVFEDRDAVVVEQVEETVLCGVDDHVMDTWAEQQPDDPSVTVTSSGAGFQMTTTVLYVCLACGCDFKTEALLQEHMAKEDEKGVTHSQIVQITRKMTLNEDGSVTPVDINEIDKAFIQHDVVDVFTCKSCGQEFAGRFGKMAARCHALAKKCVPQPQPTEEPSPEPPEPSDNADATTTSNDVAAAPAVETASLYCETCQKKFETRSGYKRHLLRHKLHPEKYAMVKKPGATELCSYCPVMFTCRKALWRHVVNKHPEQAHTCEVCGQKFALPSKLQAHMAEHEQEMQVCPECGKSYSNRSAYTRHLRAHGLTTEDRKDVRHPCEKCGRTFRTVYKLRDHLRTHEDRFDFQCDKCGKLFRTHQQEYDHRTRTCGRPPGVPSTKRRFYQCHECGQTFDAYTPYWKHRNQHASRKWICRLCGKESVSYQSHWNHTARKHPNKQADRRECKICHKTFVNNLRLKEHELQKHIKKYACEVCNRRFSTKPKLERHLRLHRENVAFQHICKICGAAFVKAQPLEEHIKSHNDPLPKYKGAIKTIGLTDCIGEPEVFECGECGDIFPSQKEMRAHLKIIHNHKMTRKQLQQQATKSNDTPPPSLPQSPEHRVLWIESISNADEMSVDQESVPAEEVAAFAECN